MLHVGLTGNIASGKSSAAMMFAELGAHVIDADLVAHDLLASGSGVCERVIDAFGTDILGSDGAIDRKKLGPIVFFDEAKRLRLNSLMHPEIKVEIRRRILELEESSSKGIIIVDAALMVEIGNYKAYDCLVVVTCDPSLQVFRMMNRDGLTEMEARARIAAQMPIEEKVKLADYTIDTSGTLERTREQVEAIYRDLLAQAVRTGSRSRSPVPGNGEDR